MKKELKKADFDYDCLGSYKSSNQFPYDYTLLADIDDIDWGDEEPKHPLDIEEVGPFKVLQRQYRHHQAVPEKPWCRGTPECDWYKIIMVSDDEQHLILEGSLRDPTQWRVPT